MVTTRSKSVKKCDRKKNVWNVVRMGDRLKEVVETEFAGIDPEKFDMAEASLAVTAMPLSPEDRITLIENAHLANSNPALPCSFFCAK